MAEGAASRPGLGFVVIGSFLALAAPVVGAGIGSAAVAAVLLFGRRRDPVTLVGAMFVLFVAVPTRFSFVGFGPLTPGMLVGSLALVWWVWARLVGHAGVTRRWHPIHVVVVVLLIGAAIGFATMFTHPVTGEQFVNAHRSPGILLMFVGITLVLADGVPTRERLEDLLEVIVLCIGALAVCGLIEQVTGDRLFTGKHLPLLTENPSQLTITPRNGFLRIAGTAKHPIEFAVVLAATLPIAVHLAAYGRAAFRPTAKVLVPIMVVALPLAISRSGIIGAAVGVLILSLGWTWRRRASLVFGILAGLAVFSLVNPRLVETMTDLFVNVGDDTSTEARTRDYRVLDDVLSDSPYFGRGLGDYNVIDYEVFDNQYLASIVDGGYLGLGIQVFAFVAPFGLSWSLTRSARRRSTAHLARAVAASIAVLGVSWAFFDGAGYRIATALVFTMTGVVGAMWRFERQQVDPTAELGSPVPRSAWGHGAAVSWGAPWRPDPLPDRRPLHLPEEAPVPVPVLVPTPSPISVVIPAHDEALVIERCLAALFADARPDELDVVVAANGCSDDTVALARRWPVRVLDLPEASKHVALNRGDEAARHFPRFYVDADVQVSAGALREVGQLLESGEALAAAPRLDLDLAGCRPSVRAYYRVWRQLPWCTEDLVGSGVYGVSERGHRRLGPFPEVIADDLWFRNRFPAAARRAVTTVRFVQQPPRDLGSLLRVRTRQVLGNLEYRTRFGHFGAANGGEPIGQAGVLKRMLRPRAITGAPVYVMVNLLARRAARRRWQAGELQWDADLSARLGRAT